MYKQILFVLIFTILFNWALNLSNLSQTLAKETNRKIAYWLSVLAGFLMAISVIILV